MQIANRRTRWLPSTLALLVYALVLLTSAGLFGAQVPVETDPRERPRPLDGAALLELFAASPGFEAGFEEEKHLKLLARPLSSRGRLYFLSPGYMLRQVTHPEPASVRITPRGMRTQGPTGERQVDFASAPELRLFATSLVSIFAGDRAALEAAWRVEFKHVEGHDRAWTLELSPRTDLEPPGALAHLVRRLLLRGEGQAVLAIELEEPNGDRTLTRIVDANPVRRYSPVEKRDLFGIPLPAPDVAGGN